MRGRRFGLGLCHTPGWAVWGLAHKCGLAPTGQQQVKYVNDEALEGLEDDEEDDEEEEKAHSERAGSGVAASTSASAASGGDRAAGGKGSKAVKAAAAKAADDDGMDDYLDELFGPDEDAEDEEDEGGKAGALGSAMRSSGMSACSYAVCRALPS